MSDDGNGGGADGPPPRVKWIDIVCKKVTVYKDTRGTEYRVWGQCSNRTAKCLVDTGLHYMVRCIREVEGVATDAHPLSLFVSAAHAPQHTRAQPKACALQTHM